MNLNKSERQELRRIVRERRKESNRLTLQERMFRGETSIALAQAHITRAYLASIAHDPVFFLDTEDGDINVCAFPRDEAIEVMRNTLFKAEHIKIMANIKNEIPVVMTGDCWGVYKLDIPPLHAIGSA